MNIAAMYQNINMEAAEIVDVMQRKNRALGGSVIIIDESPFIFYVLQKNPMNNDD